MVERGGGVLSQVMDKWGGDGAMLAVFGERARTNVRVHVYVVFCCGPILGCGSRHATGAAAEAYRLPSAAKKRREICGWD